MLNPLMKSQIMSYPRMSTDDHNAHNFWNHIPLRSTSSRHCPLSWLSKWLSNLAVSSGGVMLTCDVDAILRSNATLRS